MSASDTPGRLDAIAARIAARHVAAGDADALIEALGHERKPVQRRAGDLLVALGDAEPAIRARLLATLRDPSPRRRWAAAYALAQRGQCPPEALPVLLEAVGGDDGDLRWAAAGLLVAMGPAPEVTGPLRALVASPHPVQRKMALYCLRDLGHGWDGAVEEIGPCLGDPDPAVRLAALAALPRLAADPEAAAARILPLLGDGDGGVQRAAIAALGRLRGAAPTVRAALERLTASDDVQVRRVAAAVLRRLG